MREEENKCAIHIDFIQINHSGFYLKFRYPDLKFRFCFCLESDSDFICKSNVLLISEHLFFLNSLSDFLPPILLAPRPGGQSCQWAAS